MNNPVRFNDPTGHLVPDDNDGGCYPCTPPSTPPPDDESDPTPDLTLPNPEDLPCGGLLTCEDLSLPEYAESLLPFTRSEACYFLLHDYRLCYSGAWQNSPGIVVLSANFPNSGYCANISGLACAANLSQDIALLIDLVGVGLIEAPAVALGFAEGGPLGAAIAEVGVIVTWNLSLGIGENISSFASFAFTFGDDFLNNGAWGENSTTSAFTFAAGQIPLTPSYDLVVDGYASGYNHGVFNGISTIGINGLFRK